MKVGDGYRLDELARWVEDATRDAGASHGGGPPRLVESWQSRTATLHRFSWPESSLADVVVKVHRSAGETQTHFASMRRVAGALERAAHPDIAVVKPLDRSVEIGAVLMPFVPGESLASHLVDRNWSSRAGREEIYRLVNRCGVLLAAYHEGQSPPADEARREATDRLRTRIERALDRDVDLTGVRASGPVVQCYRDFHPGHVIVTPAGKLALIDPPIEVRYDYFYRDLALFSHNVFMSLIEPRAIARNPLRMRHGSALGETFLEGYIAATNHSLTEDDVFYIRGWEAFYLARMLRKARQRRSYGLMTYYYAPMRHRLRRLRRALNRHLEQPGRREQ